MKNYILYLNMLLVLVLSACSDDYTDGRRDPSSEEAVTFFTEYPSWGVMTRAGISVPEKTSFEEGDVIHVQGDFTTKSGEQVRRYDTYKYAGGKWIPNPAEGGETRLKWPWNAEKGTFTAYFVVGANTALSGAGGSFYGYLGGNYSQNDPLKAVAVDVAYGHAVNFKFEHLCTRLIILNTKNNYAEEYWFRKTVEPVANNAYRLTYAPETETGLKLAFTSDAEKNEGAISTVKVLSGETDMAVNTGYVVLYLEPDKYKGSELNYSGNRLYLSLDVDALDKPAKGVEGLQAGQSYILDIEKASGIIDQENDKDPWADTEEPVTDFGIQDFLDAIASGKEYKDILQLDNAGNLVLMKNLDFKNEEYEPKNVPVNITLDGNFHYITNRTKSLFHTINGNVRNLEIRNVKIENYDSEGAYRSGALARVSDGNIDNIRLRNIKMTLPGVEASDRTMTIGGLVGDVSGGSVSDIYIIGNYDISLVDEKTDINGHVLLGGVVGQATGNATIKGIHMLQDEDGNAPEIHIVLKNYGSCTAGIGGIVGALAVNLEDCTLSATIDCSESTVLNCRAGGLVGRDNDTDKDYVIKNCNVSGTVYGPFCKTVSTSGSVSYGRSIVGGIGGGILGKHVKITDCTSFCEVFDYFSSNDKEHTVSNVDANDIYATGGAFGNFQFSNSEQVTYCTAWGKVNAKDLSEGNVKQSYIGRFIGYTKNEFTLHNVNKVNTLENSDLPDCGGVFTGHD